MAGKGLAALILAKAEKPAAKESLADRIAKKANGETSITEAEPALDADAVYTSAAEDIYDAVQSTDRDGAVADIADALRSLYESLKP